MARRWWTGAAGAVLAVGLGLGLGGCGGPGMPIPDVELHAPPSVPMGTELASLRFDSITYAIPPGTTVGGYGGSIFSCAQRDDAISWLFSRSRAYSNDFEDIFFDRMRLAGHNMVGDPNSLFKSLERGSPRTDYYVGGRIDDIRLDLCHQRSLFSGDEKFLKTGRGYVKMEWQVFSRSLRKVVYTTSTEGVATLEDPTMMAVRLLVNAAFGTAVSNLAADSGLMDLVMRDPDLYAVADREVGPAPLLIPETPLFETPFIDHADRVRAAVVTVDVGDGHGSGVFISPSMLLTNDHVVEGQETVMVRSLDGEWRRGTVLRRDRRRDVALVQVSDTGHPFLPVRTAPVALTEDVFAIGTPRRRGLAGTVTKGIVSGFPKNDRGLTDIQADVAVNPGNSGGALVDARGNLVGLTYAGFADAGGGATGLNLFVALPEALRVLNLVYEPPLPTTDTPWDDYPDVSASH